jgi:hypothetical protein
VDIVERFRRRIRTRYCNLQRMPTPVEAMQGLLIEEDTTCTGNPADTWKSQLWTFFAWLLEAASLKHRGNGSDGDSPSVSLSRVNASINSHQIITWRVPPALGPSIMGFMATGRLASLPRTQPVCNLAGGFDYFEEYGSCHLQRFTHNTFRRGLSASSKVTVRQRYARSTTSG